DQVWQTIRRQRLALERTGELSAKRTRQLQSWLWAEIQSGLLEALRNDADSAAYMKDLEQEVKAGAMLPPSAARRLIKRFRQL
ncbi:MAG: methylmalonyl Co-A mutase-associated GTPase MeaB, partial [Geminicoccaceae bacterium]